MTLLNQYSTEAEAYIAKGMLASYGIQAEVLASALSSIYPTPDAGNSYYSLYCMDSSKAEEAARLLREHGDG